MAILQQLPSCVPAVNIVLDIFLNLLGCTSPQHWPHGEKNAAALLNILRGNEDFNKMVGLNARREFSVQHQIHLQTEPMVSLCQSPGGVWISEQNLVEWMKYADGFWNIIFLDELCAVLS